MFNRRPLFLFFVLFLFSIPLSWAVTVTNNGNIPVRVQYKTPDGQYQDLGTLPPGQSADVPGGVEKVRIVRQPGEWAKPLGPGEILDVDVKDGDKTVGKMDWYGGKVFFDPLTQGPPPVTIGTTPLVITTEPPKVEPVPSPTETTPTPAQQEKTESETESPQQNWPWYGGMSDSIFFIQLLMMWPFLFLLWFRHWRQPRYYLEGEYIEGGWGWGWGNGTGCGVRALIISLLFGLALGGVALWGHAHYMPDDGLVDRFGQDLFSFPYFIFSTLGWGRPGISEFSFILLFYTLTCGSFGALCSFIPIQWLYATPFVLAVLPFFLLTRGCAGCIGPESFAYDGGYEGMQLYPSAFSSLFFVVMLFAAIMDWNDPYYYEDEEEYEDEMKHREEAVWDFLHGNPWPLLVFLTGGCLCSFYGYAYYYGWDYAIGSYFYDAPMSLGFDFFPPILMIGAFWMILSGMFAWAYYSNPARLLFYSCLIPAFLIFLFLMTGDYPQRIGYFQPIRAVRYIGNFAEDLETTGAKPPLQVLDRFGDQVGQKGWGNTSSLGRNLLIETREGNRRFRDEKY